MKTIFFSSHLKTRFPEILSLCKTNLETHGYKVTLLKTERNIWLRDFLPLRVGDHFVRFVYKKSHPNLTLPSVPPSSAFALPCVESPIIADNGGSIMMGYGKAFLTEKIFKDNPPRLVLDNLSKLLDAEIVILPDEPGDGPPYDSLGHADGLVALIDNKTVMINDYSTLFERDKRFINYEKRLLKALKGVGLEVVKLPLGYGEWDWSLSRERFYQLYPNADDFNPGFGYYINFLKVGELILFPVMGIPMDVLAYKKMREYFPGCQIICINCRDLSMLGGLLHCISWEDEER